MSLLPLLANILFIGQTLVGPTLPDLTEAALRQQGAGVTVEAQVIDGASLRSNWDRSAEAGGVDARARLAAGAVDVLVLTEALPLANHLHPDETAAQALRFATLGLTANPALQTYLYETWHSLDSGTPQAPAGDPGAGLPWRDRIAADLPVWEGIIDSVNAARPQGTPPMRLIPAGQAMARLAEEIDAGRVPEVASIRAFFADDLHPNHRGWQFVALVQAAAISGESVEGLPARLTRHWPNRDAVISDALSDVLQRIASETVADYRRDEAARPVAAPPAAVPAPPAASLAPVTNPDLALGLSGLNDWTVQQPFIDVMKTARSWVGHFPGKWGGWGHDELAAGGWLDENGWLREMPPELSGVSTLFLTGLPPDAGAVGGRYRLTYAGKGEIGLMGRSTIVREAPGEIWFDFTPGEGSVVLTIHRTDPADPIRNIVVVKESNLAAMEAGAIFNPDWVARIQGVSLVRFMDWMATNDSVLVRAEDRPMPGDYTWSRIGVPLEVMLELANDLQADAWFTLPHLADDDLVRTYAEIVRDGLDPGLRAHVEFSNEIWNWQFGQTHWASAQGQARWGKDNTWVEFAALRAAETMDIWTQVFAGQSDRLVRVIGVQTGWLGLEDLILDGPEVAAEGRDLASSFDAYAVTGYFGNNLGGEIKAPIVKGWLKESRAAAEAAAGALTGAERSAFVQAHRFDLAVTRAATELRDGSLTGDGEDSLTRLLTEVLPHHAAAAREHGLKLVMYEGGTHVAARWPMIDDPELTEFLIHLNYTPEMGALYQELLIGWHRLTDAPFNAFGDVAGPSKWGSWGALRHLTDDNPRWQALAAGCGAC